MPSPDVPACQGLLRETIDKGTIVVFPHEGSLCLGVVKWTEATRMRCGVRTLWVRRGRDGFTDFTVSAADCVVIPQSRLRRGDEIHERLLQECQTS